LAEAALFPQLAQALAEKRSDVGNGALAHVDAHRLARRVRGRLPREWVL